MNNQINLTSVNRVIPKNGHLMYENKPELIMCKPKLIPLKSLTMQKLEDMQKEVKKELSNSQN